nr:MAG TPA: hypothetical protein [Bacteriophage sp.]
MKYIILYLALEGNDYAPSYDVAYSKEDIPRNIRYLENAYLARDFEVFELGEEVTEEFIDNKE